jgi:broad specificity phosphatase PhoE
MPTRLILISHAATPALRKAAFPLDESVDEQEIARISALQWNAPRAKQIFAAPERRTRQTAEALGLSFALANDLSDCDYGRWKGYTLADIQEQHSEEVMTWLTDPKSTPHGGESIYQIMERVRCWLDEQHDAGTVVAVTHPAVIRSAILYALNAPPTAFWRVDIAPLSLTDLRFHGQAWTLRSSNCSL